MLKQSRAHLHSTGESYGEHLRFAMRVGGLGITAGFAAMIHAVVPALCETTASRTVDRLNRLIADRHQSHQH